MPSPADTTVIACISGGVDSAVAAALLIEQGYTVQGLHMTNWDAEDEYCEAAADLQAARAVCAELDIPLHTVNFAREYQERVFVDFLAEYRAGRTPNPDVACNRYIKFGECLAYAARLGGDFIATGHYARIDRGMLQPRLLKGLDANKDQSYFLHAMPPSALSKVLFPLGELTKPEVRQRANRLGLPNYARRDSTGICFIGERPMREFLQRYLHAPEGPIEAPTGQVLGQHHGLMYYTLGQRQGLGIGGVRGCPDEPWYVAAKDADRNVLTVVQGRDHPLLWYAAVRTEPALWLAEQPPAAAFECTAKTRYRQHDIPCRVQVRADGGLEVTFAEPVWAATPGQYAVLYRGAECLGGAVIAAATGVVAVSAPDARKTA